VPLVPPLPLVPLGPPLPLVPPSPVAPSVLLPVVVSPLLLLVLVALLTLVSVLTVVPEFVVEVLPEAVVLEPPSVVSSWLGSFPLSSSELQAAASVIPRAMISVRIVQGYHPAACEPSGLKVDSYTGAVASVLIERVVGFVARTPIPRTSGTWRIRCLGGATWTLAFGNIRYQNHPPSETGE